MPDAVRDRWAEWVLDHRADVHAALAIPALRAIDGVEAVDREQIIKLPPPDSPIQ